MTNEIYNRRQTELNIIQSNVGTKNNLSICNVYLHYILNPQKGEMLPHVLNAVSFTLTWVDVRLIKQSIQGEIHIHIQGPERRDIAIDLLRFV